MMTGRLILGVDVGRTGAFACLTDDGTLCWVEDMPDPLTGYMVAGVLLNDPIHHVIIERAQARPKERAGAAFNYGCSYATVTAAVSAWAAFNPATAPSFETVPAATWKKQLGLGKDKSASRAMAQQLWPKSAHLFTRVRDDGRAEAALIGLWYLRRAGKAAA